MRAFDAAMAAPWAMLPESVEQLLDIASREHDPQPEALEAYRASRAEKGERLEIRGNVGILGVRGPLFKRANLMTAFSGATSYEMLRRDLQASLDNKAIDSIMLLVDSPGGEVSGCDELAVAIFEARRQKPITAFVSGTAASAAYWIASAADKIVVSDSSMLGSIGVVLGITDRSKADEKAGVSRIEYVSSQSPGKRPDHGSDEGKARIQKLVDDLGAVFVAAVATHRGVSTDDVLQKFGAGGLEVGANAVALGMADELGQFEAALDRLALRGKNRRFFQHTNGSFLMSTTETADIAKLTAEAAAKAQTEERNRISAINGSEGSGLHPKLAAALVTAGTPAETAASFLKAAAADTQVSLDAAKAEKKEPDEDPAKAYEQQRLAAAGLAQPGGAPTAPAAASAGWAATAKKINDRRG